MTGYDKIKKFVLEVHEINCALTNEIIEFIDEVILQEQVGKSALEEAEEYEKHFARIIDLGLSCTIKDLEYSMRIIERLKSEIERLKS